MLKWIPSLRKGLARTWFARNKTLQPPPSSSLSPPTFRLIDLFPYGRHRFLQPFKRLKVSFFSSNPFPMHCRSETFREGLTIDSRRRCLMQPAQLVPDLYRLFLLSRDLSKIWSQGQPSHITTPEGVAARLVTVHSEKLPRSLASVTARFIPGRTLNELVYPEEKEPFSRFNTTHSHTVSFNSHFASPLTSSFFLYACFKVRAYLGYTLEVV